MQDPAATLEDALFQIKRVIVGQDRMVERAFVCLLARGHCLIEGVPGLAKTLTVSTMATVVGGSFTRIQFTPDLVPADIVGTRIWRPSQEEFDIEWGPVFANLVLADEINRAPAKVQSALLEVMAERQVSIGGHTRRVPEPFLVLATQNPIESEGVYALPEAQRDRFLMQIVVEQPSYQEEVEIAHRMSVRPPAAEQVLSPDHLMALQRQVDEVFVHHAVQDYAVRLVMATREPARWGLPGLASQIALGASPRATLGLLSAGRALALLRGRRFLVPQDVYDVAPEVLRHRLLLTYDGLASGIEVDAIVVQVLATVQAPRVAPSQDETGRVLVPAGSAPDPGGTRPFLAPPWPGPAPSPPAPAAWPGPTTAAPPAPPASTVPGAAESDAGTSPSEAIP
ncbi:MAG TPA: MoxR family ATPase [Acidimicrobiales bacterium]|jgi:MoxR-like ATPase|nr:MoxR family ATPase [Acidimicrobiales bacterium]